LNDEFQRHGLEGSGEQVREVGPLGLVLKGGLWYLVAMAAGRPRTWRVSNIRRLEVTEQPVKRPPRFALGGYWPKSVAQFEARLMPWRARPPRWRAFAPATPCARAAALTSEVIAAAPAGGAKWRPSFSRRTPCGPCSGF
jgi:predicted DNA-binding transcriptional regulator YafY